MKLFGRLAIAAGLALSIATAAEAKEKVVIGEQSWTGATAIQNVLKAVIEKYLDGEVSFLLVAEEAMYPALDKGDGSIDVVPDLWSQHTTAMMNAYVLPGSKESIRLNKTPYKGTEGIFVPGGRGFCHHSNYTGNPGGSWLENPHWRNFMSRELFAHYAALSGLRVLQSDLTDWGTDTMLDCYTSFEKPA